MTTYTEQGMWAELERRFDETNEIFRKKFKHDWIEDDDFERILEMKKRYWIHAIVNSNWLQDFIMFNFN